MTKLRNLTVAGMMALLIASDVFADGYWSIDIPSSPMDYTPTNTVFAHANGSGWPSSPAPTTNVAFRHFTSTGASVTENFVSVTATPVTTQSGYTFWEWSASIPPAPTWELSAWAYYPFSRLRDKYIESYPSGYSGGHQVNP